MPALREILACADGSRAWKMLVAYLTPIRDAIWAKRREVRPKRGGRTRRVKGTSNCLQEALAEAASMRAEVEIMKRK